ncbi:MAG: Ig-like domain-containing protein [Planctomycetota bacterium]|nr:Ig-like domain-containing protein [Planctomycetota bacterium]
MKKQLGKLFQRQQNERRARENRQRKLELENLEGRQLLAADLGFDALHPHHNTLLHAAEDTNRDGYFTPMDALLVINKLNNDGGELPDVESGDISAFAPDVNNDGVVSPVDAFMIISRLNAGEGETQPTVVFSYDFVDSSGAPITSNQVTVGQQFGMRTFTQDTRGSLAEGVAAAYLDIGFDNVAAFDTNGAVEYSELYDFFRTFSEATDPDRFDDTGASAAPFGGFPGPSELKYVFTVPMTATAPGQVTFTGGESANSPLFDVVTGITPVPPSMIEFGQISLTVVSDPTAPVAVNDTLSLEEDNSLTLNGNVTANDTIFEGRTASIDTLSTIPGTTVGSLNGNVYTPPADFFGTDTLVYTIRDSADLTSNEATITINVTPVNDGPTAVDHSFDVIEETTETLTVLANDLGGPANESGDILTITSVGPASNGGSVTIAADGSSLDYTPASGFLGTDTFSYTVEDQGGLSDTATVTVNVVPAALPSGRTDRTTVEEGNSVVIDVLSNDLINDGSTPTLISVADGAFGTVTINEDKTVTYTPNDPNFFGTDTFTYVMNDTSGLGEDSTGTVTVTVTNVNDPPELMDDTAEGTEDTPVTIAISTLLSNDSPGAGEGASSQMPQSLTLISVEAVDSSQGSVVISGENVIYTPAPNFYGDFAFTYTAEDNGTPPLSGTATVIVSIAPVNDAPIAGADTVAGIEDQTLTIEVATLLANDSPGPGNESGQTLSIVGVSGSTSAGGTVTLDGSSISYTPAANFFGVDTFTYTLSDGNLTSVGTVTVNVAPANDGPVAADDTLTGFNAIPLVIPVTDLTANDSAGPANEDQTLTITSVSPNADINGTVTLNNDGTITYIANETFSGEASFDYTVEDSDGASDTATVFLTIREFQPSDVSGTVWVDETNDGIVDAAERRVANVMVSLSGTALGESVAMSVLTLSDGSYSFDNLAPGTYTVSYAVPEHFTDGYDVAGLLGDSDNVENQFTIEIDQPGGFDAADYNFAVEGLSPTIGGTLDQLASRYFVTNPSLAYNGAYFAVGADNSLMWSAKLDGFDSAAFAEAVVAADGSVLLSYVDQSGNIFTSKLGRGDFVKITDDAGVTFIRVLGSESDFSFEQVNLQAPPYTANNYLAAIDSIFEQEGWDY